MADDGLDGARVIVTAGAKGIGRAIAARFAEAGARVHVCDVASEDLTRLNAEHPEIGVTRADVASPTDVERLFDDAGRRLGGLDILVNNAGIPGPVALAEDIDRADWIRTLDVDLTGTFLCTKRAIPMLKQNAVGSIVNMSSVAGLHGLAMRSPYVAAKWALIGLTRTMAKELGPFGVRVNAICPGNVEGDRIDRVMSQEAAARGISRDEVAAEWLAVASLGSFISVDDVASLILFLCSTAGAKISGQALAVDGHIESL